MMQWCNKTLKAFEYVNPPLKARKNKNFSFIFILFMLKKMAIMLSALTVALLSES